MNEESEKFWELNSENIEELHVWSSDNWGEFLLENPSGYDLFELNPNEVKPCVFPK